MKRNMVLGLVSLGVCVLIALMTLQEKHSDVDATLGSLCLKVTQELARQGLTGNQMGVFSCKRGSRIIVIDRIDGDTIGLQDRLSALEHKKLITQDLHIADDTFLFLNGSCVGDVPTVKEVAIVLCEIMVRNPGRVFYLRGKGEDQVPFNVYHALNKPYASFLEQALRDLFSRLLVGAYIFAEDLQEAPLKVVPVRISRENFSRITCTPIKNKQPLIALCALDNLCSYKEGVVRTVTLTNYSYVIITLAETLEKTTASYYSVYDEKPLRTEFLKAPVG